MLKRIKAYFKSIFSNKAVEEVKQEVTDVIVEAKEEIKEIKDDVINYAQVECGDASPEIVTATSKATDDVAVSKTETAVTVADDWYSGECCDPDITIKLEPVPVPVVVKKATRKRAPKKTSTDTKKDNNKVKIVEAENGTKTCRKTCASNSRKSSTKKTANTATTKI